MTETIRVKNSILIYNEFEVHLFFLFLHPSLVEIVPANYLRVRIFDNHHQLVGF